MIKCNTRYTLRMKKVKLTSNCPNFLRKLKKRMSNTVYILKAKISHLYR